MNSILVVDDDPAVREMLCRGLSRAGYEVRAAANGKEASVMFKSSVPDIVVTDMFMPEKDGLETVMELRKNFPQVRIIGMSGSVAKTNILTVAAALGAACTLAKPFGPAELIRAIEHVAKPSQKWPE